MATMDPMAGLPPGEPLLLAATQPKAPITQYVQTLPQLGLPMPRRKTLRPPKERLPVATTIDPVQVRNSPTPVPLAPVQPAPAPTAQAVPLTFPGGRHDGTSIPPDTSGAVGPAHVFNPLNNNVWYFDRNGAKLFDLPLDSFWTGLLQKTYNAFDPRTVYDHGRQRFIFVSVADAREPSSAVLVAASKGADPTQDWFGHAIAVDEAAQGPIWFDYPSVGFSDDKVTVQVNLFRRDNNAFAGSTVYVFDKNSLYSGQPVLQRFVLTNQGGTQVPVTTYDASMRDQLLVSRWTGNSDGAGYLVVYRVSGNVAGGLATLSRVGFITSGSQIWDSFPPGDLAPQLGIVQKVDVGDDRILGACLRNSTLYCSQAVMLPAGGATRSACQWWEIDTNTWQVSQLGRIDDASGANFYAFPTIAANREGDVLLGFAQFSASTHPSASFAIKKSGGALQGPHVFAPGRATYFETFSGTKNRWGDYSATMVDPDDLSFWTVQEFADMPANTWATMWARISPPGTV